jgi:hypothetical protein
MQRCRPPAFAALIMFALAAVPAAGEQRVRPPRPYTPVAITLAPESDDVTLASFRAELAAIAKSRIYAELAQLVHSPGFFWDRDFGHHFDPRKPAVDNLAAALRLELRGGIGWDLLAAFSAEPAVEPMASRPGVLCAPARPTYDGVALARLLDDTNTVSTDWAYPDAVETTVRAAPQPDATAIGTLGLHFIRLLGYEGSDSEPFPARTQWARIVAPDGRIGFVAPGALRSPAAERLCYIKDLVAGWRIAGYVAGGH